MAETAVEERLINVEVRLAKLEGTVEARERDLPSRLGDCVVISLNMGCHPERTREI